MQFVDVDESNLKEVFVFRSGKFAETVYWVKHYTVDLPKLFSLLSDCSWCDVRFDNEANSSGSNYVTVHVLSVPLGDFTVLLNKGFGLKFNVFSNGKLTIWDRGCGKNLPLWFDEFFLNFVFFCLMRK